MFGKTTEILEALATIKADTNNHNGELQEFKTAFKDHVEKEDLQRKETNKAIEQVRCELHGLNCPYSEQIDRLENHKEEHEKTHAEDDKESAKNFSTLQTSRKYNYLGLAGLYTLIGIIFKKLFLS